MKKILLLLICFSFLAVSCSPFGTTEVAVGIVKTANGGIDWQSANQIKDSEQMLLNKSISKLKFNQASNTIYASAYDGGIYKSIDGAENWEEVLGQIEMYDFAFDQDNADVIYGAGYLNTHGRIFKTIDGGKSWKDVFTDAGEQNPARAVAVNPFDNQTLIGGLGQGVLIISQDSGTSWRLLENFEARINQIVWEGSDIYVVVKEKGVYKSTDNGENFVLVTNNLEPRQNSLGFEIFGSRVRDFRQMAFEENAQTLYLTTNNGLYRSNNGGESWSYVSMPYRQTDAAPHAVALASNNQSVIYVSSGSIIFKSTDGGFAWSIGDTLTNGLVTTILVSPDLPTLTFAGISK